MSRGGGANSWHRGHGAAGLLLGLLLSPGVARAADAAPDAGGAAPVSPSNAGAPAEAGSFTWHFDWQGWDGLKAGLSQRTFDFDAAHTPGALQLDRVAIESTISGKLEFDAAAFDTSGSLTGFDNGVDLRRARIKIKGDSVLVLPFLYRLDIGYVPKVFTVTQAYLEFPGIGGVGDLGVGVFQPPMGLDLITSSWDLPFMEPAAPLQALLPRTQPGIQLARAYAQGRATWAAGLFGDADSNAEYGSGSQNLGNLLGRATWLAVDRPGDRQSAGRQLLHLGLSASFQHATHGKLQYRSRPESYIAPYAIDSGTIAAKGALTVGAEAAWIDGAFTAQAEIVHASVDQTGAAGRLNLSGAYASASWNLTGESRPYDRQTGSFGRLVPRHDFSWGGDGGWGAFELAARYSYTDLNDRNIQGGRLNLLIGGLNWFPQAHIRWMFELGAGKVRGGGASGDGRLLIAQARVGLDF